MTKEKKKEFAQVVGNSFVYQYTGYILVPAALQGNQNVFMFNKQSGCIFAKLPKCDLKVYFIRLINHCCKYKIFNLLDVIIGTIHIFQWFV